jgi:hypothetical protein
MHPATVVPLRFVLSAVGDPQGSLFPRGVWRMLRLMDLLRFVRSRQDSYSPVVGISFPFLGVGPRVLDCKYSWS